MRAPLSLVIALACVLSFGLGWWLSPPAPSVSAGSAAGAGDEWKAPVLPPATSADIAARLRRSAALGVPEAAAELAGAPAARGDWRFAAVVVTGSERSVSIVRPGGKAQELKEGDELPGGARIVRILPDHLIISLQGRKARLDINP